MEMTNGAQGVWSHDQGSSKLSAQILGHRLWNLKKHMHLWKPVAFVRSTIDRGRQSVDHNRSNSQGVSLSKCRGKVRSSSLYLGCHF